MVQASNTWEPPMHILAAADQAWIHANSIVLGVAASMWLDWLCHPHILLFFATCVLPTL